MQIAPVIRQKSTDWVLQFINIVFLLLLYFMVNGSIIERQRTEIELPLSVVESASNPPQDAVYIDRRGDLYFHDAKITVARLAGQLATNSVDHTITIVADKLLPAATLIAAMESLRRAGFPRLSVVTLRQPGK